MTWDQDYLKEKHILLIGCGGLAHAALPYLLSSGIGKATLFDGDLVESSNLNRQHLFTPNDLGKNKAAVLKDYCSVHFPQSIIISEEQMFVPKAEQRTTAFDGSPCHEARFGQPLRKTAHSLFLCCCTNECRI